MRSGGKKSGDVDHKHNKHWRHATWTMVATCRHDEEVACTPMLPSSHPLDHITTLYRQNVSKFLLISDASLRRQTTIANDNDQQHPNIDNIPSSTTSSSWMGDAARSLALRSATPFTVSIDDQDAGRKKSKSKPSKNNVANSDKLNCIATNDDDAAITRTTTLVQSSLNSWSDCICMACGTFLLPPPPEIDNLVSNVNIVKGGLYVSANIQSLPNASSSTKTTAVPPPLLPLNSHISLRPLKRGRTRRRRASRVKAKELHNRTLSLQRRGGGGGHHNTSIQLIRTETLQKEKIQRMASMYNLGDGRAKNCLVIECTFCGTKKKRKGIEIKKSVAPSSPSPPNTSRLQGTSKGNQSKVVHAKNTGSRKSMGSRVVEPTSKRVDGVSSQIRDNTDYISLDSKIKSSSDGMVLVGGNSQKRKLDRNEVNGNSPLLLQGGKKKKKKKPETKTKTGALMDFLSSLND